MKIDGLKAVAQFLNLEAKNLTSQLKVGDAVNVQILGLSKDQVMLQLPDGKAILANTQIPLDVCVGENISLVVTGKKDGILFLETLKENANPTPNTFNDENIKSILTSLKLNINSRNIEIVKEMIDRQIPINKQNIQVVLNNLAKFPELNVPKAIFMIANGVEFEERSIHLLNQYAESKIALGNQIRTLLEHIDKINDQHIIKNIYEKLSNLSQNKLNSGTSDEIVTARLSDTQKVQVGMNKENIIPFIKDNPETISGQLKLTDADIEKNNGFINLKKEVLPLIKQFIIDNVNKQINAQKIITVPSEKEIDVKALKSILQKLEINQLDSLIQKLPQKEKALILQILNNKDFNENGNAMNVNKDVLLIKNNIKKAFKQHFVSNTSAHLSEDLYVRESYKEILLKLDILKECLLPSRESRGDLLSLIAQTEDNIRFMNNLSQYNTFIQIPLNIWGQNTNGQLFILKKSRKKIDLSNASIFLSLEMPNMGLTEILINVAGKNVFCNFRVQNQNVLELIRKNSTRLIENLNNEGYNSIDINCGIIQQRTSLLDMDKASEEFSKGKSRTFDIRV